MILNAISEMVNLYFEVSDNSHFYSVYRNAVRTDAGEDRTVSHTVPLRGDAMQRHACADCFGSKIILNADARGISTVLKQNSVLK
jgi:hypothetical protein